IDGLIQPTCRVSDRRGNAARHGRQTGPGEDAIDEVPQRQRLVVRDEVRLAGDGRAGGEPVRGKKVRASSVVDVDGIDVVFSVSYTAQLSGAGASEDAWHEV